MTTNRTISRKLAHGLAATAFLAISGYSLPLGAQGVAEQEAVNRIVGSEVNEEQVRSQAGDDRVIVAIENLSENIDTIRKLTTLDRVDIVYMPDSSQIEGGPPAKIADKLTEHSETVDSLRRELEGNALLYHAINSKNVLIQDVLAVEFDGDKNLVIFAAAKPAQ
ncbi:MAG: hypothetical protein KUA43_11500 [Hoeflea sp.]|uniref:hypothetical protein n=1 Tax=Hoeflea sp. TaxID=1940281 RepID=UPI001E12F0E6|nr:hypothetical protein [Hoeflea sp.]MBU4527635.1 hypothetical protein [Alphaproteobacteria bacterium]MBU4546497.1 hypothetical protein [Alphaproteobacteria bacterium]MBU4552985.1 hypothetical protein [Alphaproteobacteria bacterium]MBV1724057.1 hypothetical protein [Hoeflea sp.]MBV1759742.1 hypothetical protein [Hoeflea sp.]